MKITEEHYNKLAALIKGEIDGLNCLIQGRNKTTSPVYPFGNIVGAYENGQFPRADRVKDLQRRFCFDMFHQIGDYEFKRELYGYLNDDHLYTALKRCCPGVIRKY